MHLHTFHLIVTDLIVNCTDDRKVELVITTSPEYEANYGTKLASSVVIPMKKLVRQVTKALNYCAKWEPHEYSVKIEIPNSEQYIEVVCNGGQGSEIRIWGKEPGSTSFSYMGAKMRFWEAKYIASAINAVVRNI